MFPSAPYGIVQADDSIPCDKIYCFCYVNAPRVELPQQGHDGQRAVGEARIDLAPLVAGKRAIRLLQASDKLDHQLDIHNS
jgi:hypothetical protein